MTHSALDTLKHLDPVDVDALRAAPAPPIPARVLHAPADGAGTEPPRRWRPARLLAGAAAIAVAVTVAISLAPGDSSGPATSAQRALDAVAHVASAQATAPEPVTVLQETDLTTSDPAPGYTYLTPKTIERRALPDGKVRVTETRGRSRFAGPRDEARWRAANGPALPAPGEVTTTITSADTSTAGTPVPPLSELPTDASQLGALLHERVTSKEAGGESIPPDVKVFELAAHLLLDSQSPSLHSALYRVISDIPGVRRLREHRDPRGRPAIAVAMDSDYTGAAQRTTLYFDPATGQPLAQTSRMLQDSTFMDGRDLGSIVWLDPDGR